MKEKKLTPKQRAFIANYTALGTNTFGNGTRSLLAVRPGDYDGAKVQASQYLTDPNIASYIETRMEQIGLGSMFRLTTLRSVASGECTYKETRTDAEGAQTVIERQPTASDRVRAIDIASRLAGDYDRARAEGNALSARYRELARRYAPEAPGRGRKAKRVLDVDYTIEDASYGQGEGIQGNLAYCTASGLPAYDSAESA